MKSFSAARIAFPVLALMVAIFAAGAGAQMTICNVTMAGLEQCLPAVRDPNPQPPTQACCTALKPANFPCFCQYKDNPIVKTMGININLAMKLPSKCNFTGADSLLMSPLSGYTLKSYTSTLLRMRYSPYRVKSFGYYSVMLVS